MANLLLKETLLGVVDNQLQADDPPCAKEIYEKLLDAGYSKSEAKEKIAAVVLTEIYDILKDGKSFDKETYRNALEEMLEQSIDQEDAHYIETEWDEWIDLAETGYGYFADEEEEDGLRIWQEAWKIFCAIMEQKPQKDTLYGLMDDLDYEYPVDEWLEDYNLELANAGRYEERIAFCQKVLEIFDWEEYDDSCFQCGIGESLFREGKIAEAYEHYEKWLPEDPQNVRGTYSYSWILLENGHAAKAYEVVKNVVWRAPCYEDNELLFMQAEQLADLLGKEYECKWYRQQLDKFAESMRTWYQEEDDELLFDEFSTPKQIPVVKDKKIYPNDPCPCGSGKKYKKCCGKKR